MKGIRKQMCVYTYVYIYIYIYIYVKGKTEKELAVPSFPCQSQAQALAPGWFVFGGGIQNQTFRPISVKKISGFRGFVSSRKVALKRGVPMFKKETEDLSQRILKNIFCVGILGICSRSTSGCLAQVSGPCSLSQKRCNISGKSKGGVCKRGPLIGHTFFPGRERKRALIKADGT